MITRIPFGDVYGDGHGQHMDLWVSVPNEYSIIDAQNHIKNQYGGNFFSTFSSRFGDYTLSETHWEALYEAGVSCEDINKYIYEGTMDYTENQIPTVVDFHKQITKQPEKWLVFPEALVKMYILLLNEHGAHITVLEDHPFPYINGIEKVGYAAFGDWDY